MFNNYFSKFFILSLFVCGLVFVQAPLATEAFELWANPLPGKAANTIVVTTTADILDSTDGMCSLREAVISANTNPGGLLNAGECQKGSDTVTDRIYLQSGETYFLTLGGMYEDHALTGDLDIINNSAEHDVEIAVNGNKSNRPIIDAFGLGDRLFEITDATFSASDIILQKGDSAQFGIGIYNDTGTVNLSKIEIKEMEGTVGAGLYNHAGTVTLSESYMPRNEAPFGKGGAIFNGSMGVMRIEATTLRKNKASSGGAVFNRGALTFAGTMSVIQDNEASLTGGGIYNLGTMVFEKNNTTLVANKSTLDGGGIFNFEGVISGQDVWMYENESATRGGGIMNVSGEIELEDLTMFSNKADTAGSGIYNDADSRLKIVKGSIYNHLENSGIFNKGDLTLLGVDVFNNVGGGVISEGGQVTLLRSQVYENSGGSGGGIYLSSGVNANIHLSAIYNNSANVAGGGIYMSQSSLEMSNTTISGNTTSIGIGGGIHLHSGFEGHSIRFYNVTIADNSASSKKGSALSFISGNIDFKIVNTILSGPNDQTVCQNGTVQSMGHNIVSDESCLAGLEEGDQVFPLLMKALKALEAIDDTMGHLPEIDSPMVGNGDSDVCAASPVSGFDQRVLAREYGCDIGAIELLQAPPPVTETPAPSETPVTTATPKPGETPIATTTPEPGETPAATATPKPDETPEPGTGEKAYRLFLPIVVTD